MYNYVNILLLGETGVGKSTFINAFSNYVVHRKFGRAKKSGVLNLIPTSISVGLSSITVGKDKNECQDVGASATQHVKSYVFRLKKPKIKLRLIDTPGLADTRGIEQDELNCELILDYISTLKEVHAFCIVLKSNIARITTQFEYCIKQILMRLEKSAAQNIMFLITNTRSCGYGGGQTIPCLEKFVGTINAGHQVKLSLEDGKNVFYFENECFKYLLAVKNNIQGYTAEIENIIKSWEISSEQCWKLLGNLIGTPKKKELIEAHQVENTVSINEARKLIVQLSEPLAEISQLIADNIDILNKHENKLKQATETKEKLRENLYIPVIDVKITEISNAITVCADLTKCREVVRVEGKEKWHYKQICHDPCDDQLGIAKHQPGQEQLGDPKLAHCKVMNSKGFCTKCGCYFEKHAHIYHKTEYFDGKIIDKDVENDIELEEKAEKEAQKYIADIKSRKQQLEKEHDIIIKSTAQFVHFLQHNAITPFDDSYKTYIKFLIDCERSRGPDCNKSQIESMQNLMKKYDAAKAMFEQSARDTQNDTSKTKLPSRVTTQSVLQSIRQLFNLPLYGKKLKEMYEKQKDCRMAEYKTLEYEHKETLPGIMEEEIWIFINY